MSNHIISECYKRQLGGMARNSVMVLLADKASDDGTGIWASKQRMADEIGCSKQTVLSTIKSLVADGLLIDRGQRRCPNGFTVEYAINLEALLKLPLVACHQSKNLTGQEALPVKEVYPTSQAALPKPSLTPLTKEKRVHALPDGWRPAVFTAGSKSRRIVDGWSPDTLEHQLEQFAANHRSKGNKFTDWQSAWSTWVLNSLKFQPKAANDRHQKPSGTATAAERARANLGCH